MSTAATAARTALGQGARTADEIRRHARINGTPIKKADFDTVIAELVAAGIVEVVRGGYLPLVDANGVAYSRTLISFGR